MPETDNQGRTLSKEQQEFFKDSKVRDENGKLLVMYHGTPSTFTVFDISKSSYINDIGRGFHFTTDKENAVSYQDGSNQDFENKIINRTYEILDEEGLDEDNVEEYNYAYDKAEAELKNGGQLISAYLNIKNPLISLRGFLCC
jgi:hypothetical protein